MERMKMERWLGAILILILFLAGRPVQSTPVRKGRVHRTLGADGEFNWPDSYFDVEASSDVAVIVGQPAFLTCRVQMAGNWTVSWVRHRDINLLTVGTDTYTPDRRFRGLHVPNSPEWTLQIKASTLEDAGDYECQLSSTPLRTHVVRLRVIEPHIQILNGPEVYLHEGSTLNLTCVISPAVDSSLLLWSRYGQDLNWLYQNDQGQQGHLEARIHVYDGRLWVDRGGGGAKPHDDDDNDDDAREEETEEEEENYQNDEDEEEEEEEDEEEGDELVRSSRWKVTATTAAPPPAASYRDEDRQTATVSQLIVDKAQMYHSGRYICSTRATAGTWTHVHILADEQPAAMQRGNPASCSHPWLTGWIAIITVIHRYL